VSGASLRGLGSGSTLVLVDGRRVIQSGNPQQGHAIPARVSSTSTRSRSA
jgi:outer membrane receptor for ferrienterochelin and colicin